MRGRQQLLRLCCARALGALPTRSHLHAPAYFCMLWAYKGRKLSSSASGTRTSGTTRLRRSADGAARVLAPHAPPARILPDQFAQVGAALRDSPRNRHDCDSPPQAALPCRDGLGPTRSPRASGHPCALMKPCCANLGRMASSGGFRWQNADRALTPRAPALPTDPAAEENFDGASCKPPSALPAGRHLGGTHEARRPTATGRTRASPQRARDWPDGLRDPHTCGP